MNLDKTQGSRMFVVVERGQRNTNTSRCVAPVHVVFTSCHAGTWGLAPGIK